MKRTTKISISSLLAIGSLLSVAFFWRNNVLLTVMLIIISITSLLVWKKKKYLILYLIAGMFGALAESFAIYYGAWTYSNPSMFNIPVWLPFLWGEASLFIVSLLFEIEELKKQTTK